MALRAAVLILIALAACSCAPTVNILAQQGSQGPPDKRAADLESAVAQMREKQPDAPPEDPARDAMMRAKYEPDPLVVGSVVAVVNGEIITREEVLRDARKPLDDIERDPTLTEQGREMKRRELIGAMLMLKAERLLALQEARRTISPDQKERIEQDVNDTVSGVIRALGTMTRMEVMLGQEGHTVATQKQVEIDNRRIRALLAREVDARVDVTPGEVQRYYAEHPQEFDRKAQVRVREIFVSLAKCETPEQAAGKAAALRERVLTGEDFTQVVKASSDGPNAEQGGLWEWAIAGAGTFRPEVEHAAFKLRRGEVSDVVVSEIGSHVLKAEDVRPARRLSCAEAQGDILARLKRQKRNEVYAAFIKRLWDKSTVDIRWR